MSFIIRAIKRYSDITKEPISFAPTDLASVVGEALSDLEFAMEAAEARVEFTELPTLEADRAGMRQLFQNLIGNAIKYAPM